MGVMAMDDRTELTTDAEPPVSIPDTTDVIDLAAADPIPDEIIDPNDLSWVAPAHSEDDQ